MPGTRLAFTGPAARKATRSRPKGPPTSSTTALSRSSSHTETATKPSSKRNGILLQQPARALRRPYRFKFNALDLPQVRHEFFEILVVGIKTTLEGVKVAAIDTPEPGGD